MKQLGTSLFFMFFLFEAGYPQEPATEWKMARDEKDITISYRWVSIPDGRKAREMEAVFMIHSDIATLIEQFTNAEKFLQWSVTAHDCDIQLNSPTQWQTYIQFRLPWPFRSRDLITRNELTVTRNASIIKMNSTPKARPEWQHIKRIMSYQATWKFIPVPDGRTKVVHRAITEDEPDFPRAFTDPVVQAKLIASVEKLRKQVR
ncbi:hypothetical protein [Sinomicrobium weinanense]|uniref:START domain-containing protein n=1 Tax=Sinomicrobium weinanense TaxID=2842200 RepID=A0A926JQI8_9FLAO|nr:hypothetical protein [Sinomicrobium weinanense]MBC9795632.1 hypothetical protein [Sinomicrobium weinanense]MBU3124653.1 hypothetical protein [Sinomicrobium weinanense]